MLNIQTILVPQGAEHQAVCRGLTNIPNPPAVFPIPVGGVALAAYLRQLQQAGCFVAGQQVLLMGLCGGLIPNLHIVDGVLYLACTRPESDLSGLWLNCDCALTAQIQQVLGNSIQPVRAVMSNQVISRAVEKPQLAARSQADVVDMEGFTALQVLQEWGVAVATLRVVSDDCQQDIPNLAHAFDQQGSLKPVALAIALLKQPIAALHLIRSSTRSLKILQNLTSELFEK